MSGNTVYVITGANRGIGLGLTTALLARPLTTVVATVRNAEAEADLERATHSAASSSSSSSSSSNFGAGSILHTVRLDLGTAPADPEQLRAAVAGLVDHVDVLINNAGFSPPLVPAVQTAATDLRAAFETNTIAPLVVVQALWPLLMRHRADAAPRVVMVSSSVGCIAEQEAPGGAYGPSKAALNWLTRALHLQHAGEGLVAVALHPGWVRTRMGESTAGQWGVADAPLVTVGDSVAGMLGVIDGATRETVSGKFVTYTGQVLPW